MNIFLLHTVRPGLDSFEKQLLKRYPGHKVYNILNDYWNRKVLTEKESFSKQCLLYLLETCTSMQKAGADIIICTCNSLSPHLRRIREYVTIPVVLIDENMPAAVLEKGQRILAVSTAETSRDAGISLVQGQADASGISCSLTPFCRDDAGKVMREGGDMAEHDRIMLEAIRGIDRDAYDVILLSQLSTAHLKELIMRITGLPVITTPDICLDNLESLLGHAVAG